tara:strand:+ start:491 stop:2278 length:1788 start_codon:yes stop_codon:yes gene_type:complete
MSSKDSIKSRFVILKIWKYLSKKRQKTVLYSLLIMILSGFAELVTISSVIPFLTVLINPDKLLNHPISIYISKIFNITSRENLFIPIILFFGICIIISSFLRLYNLYLNFNISALIGSDLSVKAFSNNLYQPYEYHLNTNSSKFITSATIYINATVTAISNFLQLISNLILSAAISLAVFLINGKLAIYSLIIFTFVYIGIGKTLNKEVISNSKDIAFSQQTLIKSIQESLGSIRDVLLNNNQQLYIKKNKIFDRRIRTLQARNQYIGEFPRYAIEGLALLIIVIISLFSIKEFNQSSSIIILLGGFVLGVQKLLPSIQRIYLSWSLLNSYSADVLCTLELIELNVEDKVILNIQPLKFKKSIKFDKVYFSYNKKKNKVIKDLNLEIYKGQRIGIIGKTGSGKSTFSDLLMCLIKPTEGNIYVDDKDIYDKKFPTRVNKWKLSISHVPQNIYLADCSIAENIAFGIKKNLISFKRIKEAAKKAQLHDFIESTNNGYHTIIGEQGVKLSGGQRQRIGIARALYKNSDILVFDEATSALDNNTEIKLIDTINKLRNDLTIIAIAHRYSTLRNFDRILKIENGSIVSDGTPKEIFDFN